MKHCNVNAFPLNKMGKGRVHEAGLTIEHECMSFNIACVFLDQNYVNGAQRIKNNNYRNMSSGCGFVGPNNSSSSVNGSDPR